MQEIKIIYTNLAGGLMVSLFSSSVIDYEFESRQVKLKIIKFVLFASPPSSHH